MTTKAAASAGCQENPGDCRNGYNGAILDLRFVGMTDRPVGCALRTVSGATKPTGCIMYHVFVADVEIVCDTRKAPIRLCA